MRFLRAVSGYRTTDRKCSRQRRRRSDIKHNKHTQLKWSAH